MCFVSECKTYNMIYIKSSFTMVKMVGGINKFSCHLGIKEKIVAILIVHCNSMKQG